MSDSQRKIDVAELRISGKAFEETAGLFERLPRGAKESVPAKVHDLSEMSAGLYVDFITDSPEIHARLELREDPDHKVVDFQHSLDLYVWDEGRWMWTGILRDVKRPVTEGPLVRGLPRRERLYRIYLPHAGKVGGLQLMVAEDASFSQPPADPRAPVVCYGTSIVHGFSASRPGMTMPAQLGRLLNRPVVNLGIAGNARMDPELVPFFKILSPGVLVIDCLPNMWPESIHERAANFVCAMREAHQDVPILLVENIVYQATYALEDRRGGWGAKNDALKRVYADLLNRKVSDLHYLSGETLLGDDGEATVDGTHPNDLGMRRLARAYAAAIRPLLPDA